MKIYKIYTKRWTVDWDISSLYPVAKINIDLELEYQLKKLRDQTFPWTITNNEDV